MLGKGLESLIPKKNVPNQQTNGQKNEPVVFVEKNISQNESQPNQKEVDTFRSTNPDKNSAVFVEKSVSQAGAGMVPDHGRGSEGREQAASERLGERDRGFSRQKPMVKDAIFHIEVEKIKSNPLQPRKEFDQESLKELAVSIREFGILQPIVVLKIEIEKEFGADVEYQLIAGERRLMAAKLLGWERVPAIIRSVETKANQLELAIVENLQRQNLNSVETARAYAKLQDEFGLTQREVATRIGKSRETIANALRLLSLPTEIQDAIAKNQINESQARLLMTIEDQSQQQRLFKELIEKNLSVRELKLRIGGKIQNTKYNIQNTTIDPEMLDLQEKLAELLGAKVRIEKGRKEGKIIISFYSPEEIQGIIRKIQTDL
ncbi:MAG: ParB/RepB/Spo0J family partition protein [Spirochaetia bacterium]|nr:MAG: ParB/RepB/Spo0J family partition protein [Spirochaetia bacterium]